jgi:hypothetical protein
MPPNPFARQRNLSALIRIAVLHIESGAAIAEYVAAVQAAVEKSTEPRVMALSALKEISAAWKDAARALDEAHDALHSRKNPEAGLARIEKDLTSVRDIIRQETSEARR